MTDSARYDLTPKQLRYEFDDYIAPELFTGRTPERQPVLILLGGQPGAGKTRATDEILRTYPQHITAIVGDDLRTSHPEYRRLLRDAPALMPDATAQASGAWVRMAIDHALEHRHSIIVEGTFRRTELTMSEAHRFHQAGFTTHLVALAVPAPVSRLSTLQRYADGVRQAGYEGTPSTVAAAEVSTDVDRISVYARSGTAIFDQHRGPAGIQGAASAVEIGRIAPMGGASALVWLRDFHNDVAYRRDRGAVEVSMLPLLRQLAIDAGTVITAAHPDPRSRGRREAMRLLAGERNAQDTQYRAARQLRDQHTLNRGPVIGPPGTGDSFGLGR